MTWVIINVASALIVSVIVAYKLGCYHDHFNRGEGFGMALIASGMLLRIGPIVGRNIFDQASPFDDWSVLLLHVGLAMYFLARLWRVHKHWYRNKLAKDQARAHFGGVGR